MWHCLGCGTCPICTSRAPRGSSLGCDRRRTLAGPRARTRHTAPGSPPDCARSRVSPAESWGTSKSCSCSLEICRLPHRGWRTAWCCCHLDLLRLTLLCVTKTLFILIISTIIIVYVHICSLPRIFSPFSEEPLVIAIIQHCDSIVHYCRYYEYWERS